MKQQNIRFHFICRIYQKGLHFWNNQKKCVKISLNFQEVIYLIVWGSWAINTIEWNDSLLVNVDQIDEQHKELIEIAKKLHEAVRSSDPGDADKRALVGLIEYTKTHLSTEAGLMEKYSYHETGDHLKQHDEFLAKLTNLCKKHQVETVPISKEILFFIAGWLINHIMETDKKLGTFLNSKGLR